MRVPHLILAPFSLIILCSTVCLAQTSPKEPSASISGRVTIATRSASGVTVVATVSNSFFGNQTIAKATTNEDGDYKLTGLPAGRLTIFPIARAFVLATNGAYSKPEQSINVSEGEAITKIDFALVRGGVVTGRITDAEGHPLIAEKVNIAPTTALEPSRQAMMFGGSRNLTDDRGVYRVYGLSPGTYRVSVGQTSPSVSVMGMGGSQYPRTFYPSVQEEAKATIIEIKEGTEIANVDITVGKLSGGFSVSGRVVDADTGQPVPNIYIGNSTVDEATQQMGGMNFSGDQTDSSGKFRLEGLRPGHYAVFTFASQVDNSSYSDPMPFEITDGDITGIEIKIRRGATINGVAVIENNSDPAAAALLLSISLVASGERKGISAPSFSRSQLGADGSFHFTGLAPGKARINVTGFLTPAKGLTLVRTELDGVDQPDGIELTAGAQVNGVRLVFVYGTGSVRGDVKLEGGTLDEGTAIQVIIRSPPGDARRFNRVAEIDTRLHFVAENIPPGNYELVVRSVTFSSARPTPSVELLKQIVTVANGTETKVNLVVDLAKRGGQQ